MIDLGLARISRLLRYTPQTWKAIHVAGTNGKGSICAYLSAMLQTSGLSCARFTSPHLIDRWDCIDVNAKPVSEALFRETEALVNQRNKDHKIEATQFELLTAIALDIFHRENVEYGIVEVGLGGKLDATNALAQKSVTVISKIGLDHQGFLGNTLEEIALHKAGIMRRGVPCVVDHTNQPSVLRVIEAHGRDVGANVVYPSPDAAALYEMSSHGFEPHQLQNLACAEAAFRLVCPSNSTPLTQLLPAIKQIPWAGRLQLVDLSKVTGRLEKVLLDGAHNPQSAEVLAGYVNKHYRSKDQKVTWVLATSDGKDLDGILSLLVKPGDHVAAVCFGSVDGMPWVKATHPSLIKDWASQNGAQKAQEFKSTYELASALSWASNLAGTGPVVIAGSLYLVADVLRLIRSAEKSGFGTN